MTCWLRLWRWPGDPVVVVVASLPRRRRGDGDRKQPAAIRDWARGRISSEVLKGYEQLA